MLSLALPLVDGRSPMSSARPLQRKQAVISSQVMWWIFSIPMSSSVWWILIGNTPAVVVIREMHRVPMMGPILP